MGSLLNSFNITKLDLETPVGGNNRLDTITIFPATNTGTPTNTANPGKPLSFFQKFIPTSTYLSFIKTIPGKSDLIKRDILSSTNLDVEKSRVDGGIPYKQDKDPTVYPKIISGIPTTSGPGAPTKFNQLYLPNNTYLDSSTKDKLKSTTANTNLDVEDGKPNGGIPYKQDKDPTAYPATITGTPTDSANPGAPSKFNQIYTPANTYLSVNPIKGTGKLKSTVANTNLDVEDGKPGGGIPYKQDKDPTVYPKYNTGTPTTSGPGAPTKFNQVFSPSNEYIPTIGDGKLKLSTSKTNFDVESPTPNGGIPYKQDKDPTVYPTTNTGTPTSNANPGAPSKFNQIYIPGNTYLSAVGKGNLASSVNKTNLDIEDEKPNGGIPYKQDKDPTVYPKRVSGTPTTSGPGAPVKFNQVYLPNKEYLDISSKGKLVNTVANTNLDIEDEKPNGGIPYKQDKDPTVYPITTQKKSSTRGFYPIVGEAATKYDQIFSPQKTYLDFIKEYI
jgi:hypothetical protein